MNINAHLDELRGLLAELEKSKGLVPSLALEIFLKDLENGSLTVMAAKKQLKTTSPASTSKSKQKKDPATVAKTISELSSRLRATFGSDDSFEQTVRAVESSGLTKENVIELYNSVFGANKAFPKSVTKQALFNAIRKDRIAKVRAAS
jgi:hypothetical protein